MWENWSSETWIHLCWVVYLGSWVLSDRQTPSYQGREMNIEDMEARLCECRLYDRNKAMRFKTKFSGEKNRWRIKKATSARPHPQIVNILSFFIYLALLSQLFILSLNLGDLQDSAFISSLYFLLREIITPRPLLCKQFPDWCLLPWPVSRALGTPFQRARHWPGYYNFLSNLVFVLKKERKERRE